MAQTQGNGNRNQGTQQGTNPAVSNQSGQQVQRRTGDQNTGMTRSPRRSGSMHPLAALRSMSPFVSSSPFGLVRRVFDDMERMMESMMPDYDELMPEGMGLGIGLEFVPRIDVSRRGEEIVVHADLPGLSPDDLRIYGSPDGLVIEGERRYDNENRERDMWQVERSYGRFYRVIPLPDGAEIDNAQARFENGVLEVAVKAPQGAVRRQISIQTQGARPGDNQRPIGQGQPGTQQTGRPQEKS